MKNMKKIYLLAAIMIFIFCGCQKQEPSDKTVQVADLADTQKIEVVSADTSETIKTITEEKDIETVSLLLAEEGNWKMASLPDGIRKIGSFRLFKTDTVHPGESIDEKEMRQVAVITLYDDAYIELNIDAVDMIFTIDADTAKKLGEYFK